HFVIFFSPRLRPPPASTLFPYTTLFRSVLLGLGVIGEYLARIHEEVRGRPRYLVQDRSARAADVSVPSSSSISTVPSVPSMPSRSEEHTSELQSQSNLVCRLLLDKKKTLPAQISKKTTLSLLPHRCSP